MRTVWIEQTVVNGNAARQVNKIIIKKITVNDL